MENFGVGLLGGVVLVDPETGQPYRPVDGGGTGVADWSTLTGKPAVMGVGATQAEARTAIGAGVSNVASVDDLTDSTTVGRAVVKAASATAARIATNCEVIGAASALMTTHLAAADPHPGYLTPAEGNAAYPAETATTVGTLISGATAKTTPVDADTVGVSDSAASNVLKKVTWANIKATLKAYFDGLYSIEPLEQGGSPSYTWPSSTASSTRHQQWNGYPGRTDPPAATGRPAAVAGLDTYVKREA